VSGNTLVKPLTGWIQRTLAGPGDRAPEHCFQVRPHFRIPGAGTADLLTLRHDKGSPELFRVDLWTILPRALAESDVDPMLRRLHAFQAWYGDLVEKAELLGFGPDHRLTLRGNLVGASLRRRALLDLLSQAGSSLFFWTWKKGRAGLDVAPAYGRNPVPGAARARLKGLLDHLPWHDAAEREERRERAEAERL